LRTDALLGRLLGLLAVRRVKDANPGVLTARLAGMPALETCSNWLPGMFGGAW